MNSPQKTFKNKILRLLASRAKKNRCAICGSSPAPYHHLLCKSRYCRYIATPENLLPLCNSHHCFSSVMAAHSTDSLVVEAFMGWMRKEQPDRVAWMEEARTKGNGKKVDYSILFYQLKSYFEKLDEENTK